MNAVEFEIDIAVCAAEPASAAYLRLVTDFDRLVAWLEANPPLAGANCMTLEEVRRRLGWVRP